MSDLLVIFGPTDSAADSELLNEVERLRPTRVTMLLDGVDPDWVADDNVAGDALRDRMAALMALIDRRTGATVTGLAGDRDQLIGWRFDRELSSRTPVAA